MIPELQKRVLRRFRRLVQNLLGTEALQITQREQLALLRVQKSVALESYRRLIQAQDPRYQDSLRLFKAEKSVFSQNGEDGIIEELFSRIGTTNKRFVEFGVHGVKNNTTYLMCKGWRGNWLGCNPSAQSLLRTRFRQQAANGSITYTDKFITAENIVETFDSLDIPTEFDLLCIDIDGNDYWVWKALSEFRPRVVVIEYNGTFPADIEWVMDYNPAHVWDGSSYFGASLKAYERLGRELGYALVGCDFAGTNAFFVRQDCFQSSDFSPDSTAENHYEPPRYFLVDSVGHSQGFGPFATDLLSERHP